MAEFTMTLVKSKEFEKACDACQMAFGCLYQRGEMLLLVVSFNDGDMEVIRDTLTEAGSVFVSGIIYQ